MKIMNMPENERPLEKLLYSGVSSLDNSELIALIIKTGAKQKSAVQLSQEIIASCGDNICDLSAKDPRELTKIKGIGLSKAASIVAAFELGRRNTLSYKAPKPSITNSRDVANMLIPEFSTAKKEFLVALLLNVKGEIESKEIISIGELASTNVHPREVFAPAIKKGAASIIIAHNHPSGDPTPSTEDIASTERLKEASKILGIKLLDHIIIGNGRYISLRSEGLIA